MTERRTGIISERTVARVYPLIIDARPTELTAKCVTEATGDGNIHAAPHKNKTLGIPLCVQQFLFLPPEFPE